METYFLENKDLLRFYAHLAEEFNLYVPVKTESKPKVKCDYSFTLPTDDYFLKQFSQIKKEDIVFSEYRTIEPVRTFFTHAKEEVCTYFRDAEIKKDNRPIALCGVKNCDLFSLKIQDFVFLGGNEVDPLYQEKRENTLIISSDCSNFKEVCFCRAFDINPHANEGFDFNLSCLDEDYLIDVGSERARKIVGTIREVFTEATSSHLSRRSLKRDLVIKRMNEHLLHHRIPRKEVLQEIVLAGYDSQVFQEQALTCVECGGCVFMCDTCHCFLLVDTKLEGTAGRLRIWDSCLYKNFAKVAGGANPLKMRYMRLRNRYLKKFDFFIDNIGFQACCGCGRCIDVCPGKIDIRYILRRLYEEKYLSAR